MWWAKPLTPWVLVVVGLAVALAVGRRRTRPSTAVLTGVGAVTALVALWFVLLSNHSQIHPWLVYRSLPIGVGALAALVVADVRRSSTPEAPDDPAVHSSAPITGA